MAKGVVYTREWKRLEAALDRQLTAKAGIVGEAASSQHSEGLTNAEAGAIHELGLGQKERPFIRGTIERKEDELKRFVTKLGRAIMLGRIDVEQAIGLLGQKASAEIRKSITAEDWLKSMAPLAESTKSTKGHDRPLVDSGQVANSISYEVDG